MTMTSSLSDPNPIQKRDASGRGRQPNLASTDPYAVLGLMRGASLREIKRAYFSLVREYPPEEHPDTFKIIRAAYEKLRLTDVKAETDLFLFQPPAPWTPRKRKGKLDLDVHLEDIVWLLQQHGDLGRTDFRDDYKRVHLCGDHGAGLFPRRGSSGHTSGRADCWI